MNQEIGKEEVFVLAGMMSSIDVINLCMMSLKLEHFTFGAHQSIYMAIEELFKANEAVNIIRVAECLKKRGTLEAVGGVLYLGEILGQYDKFLDYAWYLKEMRLRSVRNAMQKIGADIHREFMNPRIDVIQTVDGFLKDIHHISAGTTTKGPRRISEIDQNFLDNPSMTYLEYVQHAQECAKEGSTPFIGHPTHLLDLDRYLMGLKKGHLTIIGARPGVGKTTFLCNLLESMVFINTLKCLVFSLEMPSNDIAAKLINLKAMVNGKDVSSGRINPIQFQEIVKASKAYDDVDVYIEDQPALNIMQVRSRCFRYKSIGKLDVVFIDYLQLMRGVGKPENKNLEITEISQGLKALAKEIDVPIVCLAQLNRKAAENGDPQLHELRDSGSIEQDADEVILLHCPSLYDEHDKPGLLLANVAKNRFGETGKMKFHYDKKHGKISNYTELKQEDIFADEEFNRRFPGSN